MRKSLEIGILVMALFTLTTALYRYNIGGTCVDRNSFCGDWSIKGECTRNKLYMKDNCCWSCSQRQGQCVDINVHCISWRIQGECRRNPSYMKTNCCNSCRRKKAVDGGFGDWSTWSICTRKCGGGHQERTRYCNNPQPKNGGKRCRGSSGESKRCNMQPCQIKKSKAPTCGRDKGAGVGGRIVGGDDASPFRWLWQGGIYYHQEFKCGGSLIAPDLFVTAAHCVSKIGEIGMLVRMGDYNRLKKEEPEQDIEVEKIYYHEEFSLETIQNDIAILKLKKEFRLNDEVGVVCLPKKNAAPPANSECYVTGWGRTSPSSQTSVVLQEAKLPIVPNNVCKTRNGDKVVENMICGGFQDTETKVSGCRGDAGGPYVCKRAHNWELQGVVSWGSSNCDAQKKFTVFTRISKYIDWIDKVKEELKGDAPKCGLDKTNEAATNLRIVGGEEADPNRWLWQGAIYFLQEFTCGGALIAPDLFLTAAHCVSTRNADGMLVRMGDHNRLNHEGPEQEIEVESIVYHQGWSWTSIQNDIAILKMKKKFKLNKNVGTVCLPNEAPSENSLCYITGWGRTDINSQASITLQESKLPVVPNKECKLRNGDKIVDSMLCAGFKNNKTNVSGCKGDSGGPYVCKIGARWTLQGVVSWGSNRCDTQHRFTVFTRISKYIDWIEKTKLKLTTNT